MKFARELVLPCAFCAASFAVAVALAIAADVRGTRILGDYLMAGLVATYLALVVWIIVPPLRAPEHRALRVASAPLTVLRERWPLLILPALILPVFMTGFTVSKVSVPYLTGYQWDGVWTWADALLFNGDPWRVTHQLIGAQSSSWLVWAYTAGWGGVLGMAMPLYALSVGSIHFGYNYALDGFIAAPLAWLCWRVTEPQAAVTTVPAEIRLATT